LVHYLGLVGLVGCPDARSGFATLANVFSGNRDGIGRGRGNMNDTVKLATSKIPTLVQESGICLLYRPS